MIVKKLILSSCALLAMYVPSAFADCSEVACTGVYIQSLSVEAAELSASHLVAVATTGTETALDCDPDAGAWLLLNIDNEGGKEVYALLLTAYAMDKPLKIRVTPANSTCHIAYAILDR